MEQPIAQIADTAVQTLQTLIEQPGRSLPSSYFLPTLRVRASTAKPRQARSKTFGSVADDRRACVDIELDDDRSARVDEPPVLGDRRLARLARQLATKRSKLAVERE